MYESSVFDFKNINKQLTEADSDFIVKDKPELTKSSPVSGSGFSYRDMLKIGKELRDNGVDDSDTRKEIVKNMLLKDYDFYVDDFRIIHESVIDDILKEELMAGEYLGGFSCDFISGITGIDSKAIKSAQDVNQFELIDYIMRQNIDAVIAEWTRLDGYGAHFAHYDSEEIELTGKFYGFNMFRVN